MYKLICSTIYKLCIIACLFIITLCFVIVTIFVIKIGTDFSQNINNLIDHTDNVIKTIPDELKFYRNVVANHSKDIREIESYILYFLKMLIIALYIMIYL